MDAREAGFQVGQVIGTLIGYAIIATILALIIGTLVYFIGGRKKPFMKTIFSWPVLVPTIAIAALLVMAQLSMGLSGPNSQGYSAAQISEIKDGCVETATKTGQPADKVAAYCDCTIVEIQAAYPNFSDANKALRDGVGDEIKPKFIECAKKVFTPEPAGS